MLKLDWAIIVKFCNTVYDCLYTVVHIISILTVSIVRLSEQGPDTVRLLKARLLDSLIYDNRVTDYRN